MSDIEVRPLGPKDAMPAIELVNRVFNEFVAPDFTAEGIVSFGKWAQPAALAERVRSGHVCFVAVENGSLVGLIELMPPNKIAMLFVDPRVQGEGVGKRLLEESLDHFRSLDHDLESVQVHASPYAVSFYRHLGFEETGPEQEEDGIRFTPMSLGVQD